MQNSDAIICTIAKLLTIKGISGNEHAIAQYAILTFRISGTNHASKVVKAVLICEVYIIDSLDARLFISTNVIFQMCLSKEVALASVYFDTGCLASLID